MYCSVFFFHLQIFQDSCTHICLSYFSLSLSLFYLRFALFHMSYQISTSRLIHFAPVCSPSSASLNKSVRPCELLRPQHYLPSCLPHITRSAVDSPPPGSEGGGWDCKKSQGITSYYRIQPYPFPCVGFPYLILLLILPFPKGQEVLV